MTTCLSVSFIFDNYCIVIIPYFKIWTISQVSLSKCIYWHSSHIFCLPDWSPHRRSSMNRLSIQRSFGICNCHRSNHNHLCMFYMSLLKAKRILQWSRLHPWVCNDSHIRRKFLCSIWGSHFAWLGSFWPMRWSSRIHRNSSHNRCMICSLESHIDSFWVKRVWSIQGKCDQLAPIYIPTWGYVCTLRKSKSTRFHNECIYSQNHNQNRISHLLSILHQPLCIRWHS